MGLYFLLARPALLPEDLRFTGVKVEELPVRMSEWLGIAFRTWGGFMAGFASFSSASLCTSWSRDWLYGHRVV